MSEEYVVLVTEQDSEIGTMLKSEVHGEITPLHRAFSCFIFDDKGNILLQQRSQFKKTRPLVWSNSCCGHPLPNESYEDAIIRRVQYELGMRISKKDIVKISDYRYCFSRDGVMENEFCPVFVVTTKIEAEINIEEVEQVIIMNWDNWLNELQIDNSGPAGKRSERCKEEAILVDQRLHHIIKN